MKIFRYDIKIDTFFKKGIASFNDSWGVYCVTGFQGSGKTYYAVYLTYNFKDDYKIKTNIHSLKIPNKKIEYFGKLDEIWDETEEDVLYIIDEVSKKYSKNSPPDKKFYSWLQQSRKRHRIVIMITQEWKEVPMWLRRPVRFMYHTRKFPLIPKIFITNVGDALNTVLNKDSMEWECPIIKTVIYKRTKFISSLYDTLEPINEL